MTLTRSDIQSILRSNRLSPSRALGQNFVADPNTVRKIARLSSVGPGETVVEIGAGLGSLTLALAETGAQVIALERDRALVPILVEQVAGAPNVRILQADALTVDWDGLVGGVESAVLVANLPYNIATPLVVVVLERVPTVARMLVMVQKEVGERFAAGPDSPSYGAVSVKIAYWATARVVARVPASVFVPRPNVESVLVSIVRRPAVAVPPEVASYEAICAVVNAGFATRRKMLRNALKELCDAAAFADAGVDPTCRAEDVTLEQWGRLAAAAAA